jgi:integrase
LASRDAPYWTEVQHGLRLGYRKGKTGDGVWVLREFRGGKYVRRRLGLADDTAPSDGVTILSFADAQRVSVTPERPTRTQTRKHTVAVAWDEYKATRKSPPDERELATWATFIEPKFGSREVAELTTHDIEKWLLDQVSTHGERGQLTEGADAKDLLRRARYTANRRFNLLRAILNSAYRKDRVKSADAWRKVQPFQKVDRPRTVFVDIEPARKLLANTTDPLLGVAAGALYTGLRLGELNSLRTDDIDVAGARVRVRHSKSGEERWVPLSKEGCAFFERRISGKQPEHLVFVPMSRIDVSRGMRAACKAADVVPRVTHRDLRRSYGSLMINAGAAIEVIQAVLGHADPRMTRRTYSHLLQQTVAKSVQKHLPSFDNNAATVKSNKRRT